MGWNDHQSQAGLGFSLQPGSAQLPGSVLSPFDDTNGDWGDADLS